MKSPEETQFLLSHLAHDYTQLIERWHHVAEATGLEILAFATAEEFQVFALRSKTGPTLDKGLYLSAGIHGDEPGAALGLIAWAEQNTELLSEQPCLIFPCLNPWGLVYNSRYNEWGYDLNRRFGGPIQPVILAWKRIVDLTRYRLALTLHEDYDATGIYCYELGSDDLCLGEPALKACSSIIPRHPGDEIEGRAAEGGLIHATEGIEEIARQIEEEEEGLPEALYLKLHHAAYSLTFETPSEYSLYDRVRAQVQFLDTVIETAFAR